MMQILPVSYLEWGLCLFTLWFCWIKYGWNVEVLKGMRQMYKKIEALLVVATQDTVKLAAHPESSEVQHFNQIPTSGSSFSRSSKSKGLEFDCTGTGSFGALIENNVKYELSRSSGGTCFVCECPTKTKVLEEIKSLKPLKDCLAFEETRDPSNPWYVKLFSDFLFWWRKWYVGPTYHVMSLKQTMEDEMMLSAIKEAAQTEFEEEGNQLDLDTLVKKHYKSVEAVVKRMRAKQPSEPWYAAYVRIASWIIGKFLAQIYPKIFIRDCQIDLIRKARNSGHPILYLPVHRSHIDYVLISWTLICSGFRTPMVAAGENLNIPIFSLMMKSVGGFFIKRKFESRAGKKDMYRAMLHSYMKKSLVHDNDMEFFIEGGRTRTGKPCLPKGGLLNIVMESILHNRVDDILVIPVNFSYDKIVEGNYIREQLGQPKVNESFASALVALFSSLQPKYGNARVDYGHPFSMKDFILKNCDCPILVPSIGNENKGTASSGKEDAVVASTAAAAVSSKFIPNLCHNTQRKLVEALGRHAIFEGVKCLTMTSTNALAFLLLNKFRNGVDIDSLSRELAQLREDMVARGHDSTFFQNVDAAIDDATKILGSNLVRVEYKNGKKYFIPVTSLPNVIELSYYSNCILPVYAMESIIATSVFKLLGDFCNNNFETNEQIKETELVAVCLEYADVLHNEFILCPPCTTLAQGMRKTINFMVDQGILSISLDQHGERLLEIRSSETLSGLVFLKNLLRPILDAYITASHVLKRLVDHEAEEKLLQMDMLAEIKGQLQNNAIFYGETMALDPIRNFVQRGLHWGILECQKKDLKNIYSLHQSFNTLDAVEEIIQRLGKLRV